MIVTSDNGGLADRPAVMEGYQSKGGLEGNKNSPLEKGHHVLIFIVWPSRITPGNTEELASNQDILATLAAMVCTGIPNDQAIDSNNLLPLHTANGTFRKRELFLHQAGSQ